MVDASGIRPKFYRHMARAVVYLVLVVLMVGRHTSVTAALAICFAGLAVLHGVRVVQNYQNRGSAQDGSHPNGDDGSPK